MNSLRKFHPDLQACELEDRLLPVISNLGVIVLTTGGYVLTIPSPGIAAYSGGSPGGTAIPTSFVMTGSGGISSIQPGNITGIAGLAAPGTAAAGGSAGGTMTFGSGASDATAASIPLVTRNTIANDALNPAPRIGSSSGDRSPVLPAGQFYRGGVPMSTPVPPSSKTPGDQLRRSPRQKPVDSSPIRLGGAPSHLASDVSGHSMKTVVNQMPGSSAGEPVSDLLSEPQKAHIRKSSLRSGRFPARVSVLEPRQSRRPNIYSNHRINPAILKGGVWPCFPHRC
jgi:hypothetical protein